MKQQLRNTYSWRYQKLRKTINFSRIIFEVLQLMEEKNINGERKGLAGISGVSWKILEILGALFINCMIYELPTSVKYLNISCVLKPLVSTVNFILDMHSISVSSKFFFKKMILISLTRLITRFYNLRMK
uniref:Uncharacterized protein n=1 Tax=Lepeophtheirus salmonis TaxID=72036 RepID=A0A0K2UUU1_LEPSM